MLRDNGELLSRAIDNLVANALRFGSRCRIALDAGPGGLLVMLDDDRPGIAPEDRERLLVPFELGEASRNADTVGSGPGLADRIVGRHGGTPG